MPTTYAWMTFAQMKQELAVRLGDPTKVQWIDAELSVYLQEALRTFQSLTGYWRGRATLTSTSGQSWYDLPSLLVPTLRSYNVTDSQLVALLQYSLMENAGGAVAGTTWVGTDMFTLAQVTAALTRRRDQFLEETASVLTVTPNLPISPSQPFYGVPNDSVIDIVRMAWIMTVAPYTKTPLWRQDQWQSDVFNVGWTQQVVQPRTYSVAATPVLTFQLANPPAAVGAVEMITINAGATLTGAGVLLGIPDDWTWVVKWGALADLLNADGQATDPLRASYCLERWNQGVEIARLAPSILAVQIDSRDKIVTTVADLDAYYPTWQNSTATDAVPVNRVAAMGLNLVALAPVPGTRAALDVDVVRNAPLPTLDTDFVQLGREATDAVVGYAEHLAAFKLAGNDFERTVDLYQDFLKEAAVYADRTAAWAPTAMPMARAMHSQSEQVQRRYTDAKARPSTDTEVYGPSVGRR